ncbi:MULTISPECIES: flavoprotein [unclassified Crossiella]|uniref:flavoprotein n=1 Tax=unclassified Crossiella TaxID=2620835 RepID=UPI001FFFC26A|nr:MULTISPECIES: flavoprotein [unclassified Crossiella]MCK2244321.1 hypothetical protein [Crossiella sp. S99.2]MCK2257851.1 hypothetical protein [Crossiella sp. S99.1]
MTENSGFPNLDGKRVLVVGTGAPAVVALPENMLRLRHYCQAVAAQVVLTRAALRFITPTTTHLVTGGDFITDEWSDKPYQTAPHVELAQWAEAVVVYPATLHFVGRLALGLADSPLLLALQCTAAPIAIAPSLPPGGMAGHAYRGHMARLAERANVVVVHPVLGRSMSTHEANVGAPARFTDLLAALDTHLAEAR